MAIFFDLKAAFYSVLRQSLFDDDDDDDDDDQPIALITALRRFGVRPEEIDRILSGVRDDYVAEPLHPHFRLLLKDAMVHIHFHIKGLDTVCQTHRGHPSRRSFR